jgi:predicted DCC family thiol-disulfide oxidoreductase YuxK
VVFYDAVCGLCDRSVQFLLAHDRERVLHFAPLQGPTAAAVLGRLGLGAVIATPAGAAEAAAEAPRESAEGAGGAADPGAPPTMVVVRDEGSAEERAFVRSAGALATLDAIGGGWRVVSWLRVVPAPLRDVVYRWVATHRYRWFGRFATCKLPAPEVRERFLD